MYGSPSMTQHKFKSICLKTPSVIQSVVRFSLKLQSSSLMWSRKKIVLLNVKKGLHVVFQLLLLTTRAVPVQFIRSTKIRGK